LAICRRNGHKKQSTNSDDLDRTGRGAGARLRGSESSTLSIRHEWFKWLRFLFRLLLLSRCERLTKLSSSSASAIAIVLSCV
jgi:hypothetical protein